MAEYEGVRLYTDVTNDDLKATKKALLKEMAVAGNRGMEAIKDQPSVSRGSDYNVMDAPLGKGAYNTPQTTVDAIEAEKQRMLGGLAKARSQQGVEHSEAMDRMAARNIAYMDSMSHASDLSDAALKERIAAMKLAADARAGGGGGGGGRGGGGGGGYQPAITESFDPGMNRLMELYENTAAGMSSRGTDTDYNLWNPANVMDQNPELTLAIDERIASSGLRGVDASRFAYDAARRNGTDPAGAVAMARMFGDNYGDTNRASTFDPMYDQLAAIAAARKTTSTPTSTRGRARISRTPGTINGQPVRGRIVPNNIGSINNQPVLSRTAPRSRYF